jgi:hypothetical protein
MSALMMEATRTSETLVNFYQTTQRYNPEDSHLLNKYIAQSKLVSTISLTTAFVNENCWVICEPVCTRELAFKYVAMAFQWIVFIYNLATRCCAASRKGGVSLVYKLLCVTDVPDGHDNTISQPEYRTEGTQKISRIVSHSGTWTLPCCTVWRNCPIGPHGRHLKTSCIIPPLWKLSSCRRICVVSTNKWFLMWESSAIVFTDFLKLGVTSAIERIVSSV